MIDASRPPAATAPRSGRAAWRWLAACGTVLVLAAAAGYAFLASQAGVDFVVRELIARSGGALAIEGAEGSLLDTVRLRRVAWRGPETSLEARDVALTWSPAALWSRGVVVRGLGVRTLALELKGSDADVPMPASLALPIDVTLDRLAVGQFDWRAGASHGTLRGIEFGYAGGPAGHRITDLRFVADAGTITGGAAIGATAPFPLTGRLAAQGQGDLRGADAHATLDGSLGAMTVEGGGNWGAARLAARVTLAPLASAPLRDATLELSDLDLAERVAALPTTRLSGALRLQAEHGGFVGTANAANAAPGALDAGRLPLVTLATRFSIRAGVLALDDIDATLPRGARLVGRGEVPLDAAGAAGSWSLDVRDVDLQSIYAPMVATRLTGRLTAELDRRPQRVSGNVADRGIAGGVALEFAASLGDGVVTVERFRARSGPGELTGNARMALSGERAFALDATAKRLDPARFAKVPTGALDGRLVASGSLAPPWRAHANVTLAPGSRLSGLAVAGTVRSDFAADAIRDAVVDLAFGRARLRVDGNAGVATDRLTIALDAPELAEFAPLLPADFPRTLSGALHAKAELRGLPPRGSATVDAKGTKLRLGKAIAADALDLHLAIAASEGAATPPSAAFANRAIHFAATATDLATPQGSFRTMRAALDGTLGSHALSLALAGEGFDVGATASGGLVETRSAAGATAVAWTGSLATLENRGAWAFRLAAPAHLEVARGRVRVGEARLAVADGGIHLAELAWEDGRVRTEGGFSAVPLATAARLAGVTLPFASTLTLGGAWSLAATPRLNGSVSVHREAGDVWLVQGTAPDPAYAAGVTLLEARAKFADDAVDATASFRSVRNGTADATLAIGVATGTAPGRLSPDAPLTATVKGELHSLRLLQPWLGTAFTADGRARLDLAARGTLREAQLAGSLNGEGLRISAPQYGLHFTDGRLTARAIGGRVLIDELSFRAGAGTFRATGEIAELAPGGTRPSAHLTWRAEKFRVFNRPDLFLVAGGEGTLATADGKLSLAGSLRADEGRFVYLPAPDSTLGDDVVVKGWPPRASSTRREGDVALAVDIGVDLGERLTFSGEGLETGLVGRVRVTNSPGGLLGRGTIRAVNGTYFAFGRKLAIDRGELVFDGPLDNPGLDIVALRKNLAVEAGVAVTGTVKVPVIRLTSNPPVPDGEKLSWLVVGHGTERSSSGADVAALQAASAALLGRGGKPVTTSIAQSVGLDDISLKSATGPVRSGAGAPDATGQVVAVGKRLSDRLSLIYEQGLTVATNALRLEYELTRSLTLRAEAGTISGFGIYYRRTFD